MHILQLVMWELEIEVPDVHSRLLPHCHIQCKLIAQSDGVTVGERFV